jgi:predicted phage gp36 major capsid-like protein
MSADLPTTHIRRPSTFLSLAPTTSASYPQQRSSPSASTVSPKIVAADVAATTTESAAALTEAAPLAAVEELDGSGQPKHRRSSSLASDESGNAKLRFLKLGPVHWGEGDGTGDWSEAEVAE